MNVAEPLTTRLVERYGIPMRSIAALAALSSFLAVRAFAQDSVPAPTPIPVSAESGTAPMAPAPPPPNPLQDRYLQGLRTAGRGVAQIKDGLNRVMRTQGSNDTAQARVAAKRLGALCGAARGFITSGRGQMEPTAYEPPKRKPARDLVVQLDSLSVAAKTCQTSAGKTPAPVTSSLMARVRSYEAAVAAFRTALGLPNRQ